ncbi:MAG: mismatch repair protein MutS [Bacteroidetes bacterium]|jgi:DNA mismatch repair protein MutS2|nr:mismatch repair protein MutS [Bacteroidota bacterium]MDF2452537.1 mismatch repair protein MutS [Bacteroidota bacterium]
MNIIESEALELLEFYKIKKYVTDFCYSAGAKQKASQLSVFEANENLTIELHRISELKNTFSSDSFFPEIQFQEFRKEASLLSLEGSMLTEDQFLLVKQATEISNTAIRFLKNKRMILPFLAQLVEGMEDNKQIIEEIDRIIDFDATVKNSASKELQKIRKELSEKRRESDVKFDRQVNELRKLGYIRDNEESFFNGRRTLAVLVEYKSEVSGFVHNKSETGKTIFIEPGATISINNDIAELEIDERREINRILRELSDTLRPFAFQLKQYEALLIELDFIKAKAQFAKLIHATLPVIAKQSELKLNKAYHPILFLQNRESGKQTVPLNLHLEKENHLVVISGPNAGGKSITLKTVGLLQTMLQSGLLVSVAENSVMSFFKHILIDIGDTQSIEHELSTYSARLKNMISILKQVNPDTLVLMDEFGSGTDPELGGAMAEVVLEELVKSKTFGVITTHYSNVKLLANNLQGVSNGSMLFDLETLDPKYILTVGEPGSSYTFEVAERVGFPKELINRAKLKIDTDKVDLNKLLAEVQQQKTKLAEATDRVEHQEFLRKIAKEKYDTLFNNWREKTERDRERKIDLARLADFGQRYLRLMEEWNKNEDRKAVIKRFIDGITAETNKRKELAKQNKRDNFAEKKVARLKPLLKVGSKVRILNSSEIGVIESMKDEKVSITFGILKMTVNIENLELVRD